MINHIPQCCQNIPSSLISYKITSRKYLVCDTCIQLDFWNRGIKKKIPIAELEGYGRPKSSSATELITNG